MRLLILVLALGLSAPALAQTYPDHTVRIIVPTAPAGAIDGMARAVGAKLASELWGRWVEPEESDELLAPYGEWSGLASVYLLAGYARGLVPLPLAA